MAGRREFVAIASMLTATVALSIDIMLPALGEIAGSFAVETGNGRQLAVVLLFGGLALGQLVFGPASDAFGRRPMIFAGVGIFALASLLCAFAGTYETFLLGRVLQGFGAAGPRIVTVALIRDRHEGDDMAQVMSVIMGVFVLVPVLAPGVGQILLAVMPWRGLFVLLAVFGLAGAAWLALRQKETLSRKPAPGLPALARAFLAVCSNRRAVFATFSAACCYGALMGYVGTSQQLFQDVFEVGDAYAAWFGASAAFISAAALANSVLVTRLGMERISVTSLSALLAWTVAFDLRFRTLGHEPDLALWMLFNGPALFFMGLTFGNLNAIALQPFARIAGLAAAAVASFTAAATMTISALIGLAFDGSVKPVVTGYLVCAALALGAIWLATASPDRKR